MESSRAWMRVCAGDEEGGEDGEDGEDRDSGGGVRVAGMLRAPLLCQLVIVWTGMRKTAVRDPQ